MSNVFLIIAKTHLHAGSGDSNFGVIDKLVQRDPSTGLPCIYASSLKGAFREYFDQVVDPSEEKGNTIFGKDGKKGKIIFHQANLLSLPARSNQYPFFNVTAPMAIQQLLDDAKLLGSSLSQKDKLEKLAKESKNGKIVIFGVEPAPASLKIEEFEDDNISVSEEDFSELSSLIGDRIAIVSDEYFLNLTSDYSLPVIARNNLENGQSKNLWYEQVIPRESRFYFGLTDLPGVTGKEVFYNEFLSEKVVQIGANATIGYGQCVINPLKLDQNESK